MEQNCAKRVYLDYNVYDGIAKKEKCIVNGNWEVIYSVSHVEEYYRAVMNTRNDNYDEQLCRLKNTIIEISKCGVVLNPSDAGIIEKKETFDECYSRIETWDTRDIVETNSRIIYESNRKSVEDIHCIDVKTKNNSNLDYKQIWDRQEVIDKLKGFKNYYEDYVRKSQMLLFHTYGWVAFKMKKQQYPKVFDLKRNCLKGREISFALIELLVEYLNMILCSCGYNKDKNQRTTLSGIHDVSHIIYATYCNYFVTDDERLIKRANAIYYYLGIDTEALCLDKFNYIGGRKNYGKDN